MGESTPKGFHPKASPLKVSARSLAEGWLRKNTKNKGFSKRASPFKPLLQKENDKKRE
jgi:hypothetical protein